MSEATDSAWAPAMFDSLDESGEGRVSIRELRDFLNNFPSDLDANPFLDKIIEENDGKASKEEFVKAIDLLAAEQGLRGGKASVRFVVSAAYEAPKFESMRAFFNAKVRALFESLDTNKDEGIDLDEFKAFMERLAVLSGNEVDEDLIPNYMAYMDTNRDGKVSEQELRNAIPAMMGGAELGMMAVYAMVMTEERAA